MMADLRPYPEYRESGVPWLGDVPSQWTILLNQRIFRERIRPYDGQAETPLSLSQRDGLIATSEMKEKSLKAASYANWKVTVPGDLVLNRFKAHLGVFFESTLRGIVSFHYGVFEPRVPLVTKYYELLYHTNAYRTIYAGRSNGMTVGLQNLSNQNFHSVRTLLPPITEQDAIVRFVHDLDRKVNRFIRNRRRLIEVLNEQKQAIINRAVTRGLDLNAPLKPSGIDWLDKIPAHWSVMPLKRWVMAKITDGPHETPELLDDGIDFVSAEAMVNGKIVFERRRGFISRVLHEAYCLKCRPQRDDIFMCKSGNTTGKVALVDTDREFSVWSPLALIRCRRDSVLPRLMFLALQAQYVQWQVQDRWSYGTQPNLSMGAMERIAVSLPPTLGEQEVLLRHIVSKTDVVDAAIEKAKHEIDLIREYRTRLIADVVTGKVDVRHLAPVPRGEPMEPEELAESINDDEIQADDEPELVEEADA